MPSTIRVDTKFRASRASFGEAAGRALPRRTSDLGFVLGLLATVVALAGLGWWLVQSGVVSIQINV